jgi:uncharacterized protein (TIGR03083 family)
MALNAREQLANIPVIAHETARMVQAFRSWPQSYWSRPTYCPGWTAADAVAHLATGGDFYAQVITSGRSGEPKFAWGANSPAEFREARQAAVKKLLDGGPAAVLAGFEQAGAKLQAVLESLQEADLTKVALHPRGRIPLGSWIGMRILELSAHDWDIRQRVTEGLDGVYALRAGDAAWGFTIQGKTVTPLQGAPRECDVGLSTDAESMILLTVGRADMTEKLQSAALTITGDVEQGKQLCATLFRAY